MTTETILTDEQVRDIIEDIAWPNEEIFKIAVKVSRAIEQAVLQSLPVQTSSTIRGDSYAGVYVWLGNDNILQHIPKLLAENARDPQSMLDVVAAECVKKLERHNALQSPEIQAWKRDAELFKFLLEEAWFQSAFDRFDPSDGGKQDKFESECRRILVAAMEHQK